MDWFWGHFILPYADVLSCIILESVFRFGPALGCHPAAPEETWGFKATRAHSDDDGDDESEEVFGRSDGSHLP